MRKVAVSAAVVAAVVAIVALIGRADEPDRRPLGSSLDINIGTPTATATPTATPTPTPTATPTPGVANVWIVPSGGGCSARASSPVTLASATTAQKCDTADGWEAAFLLANCGDTVLIDTGSYGDQRIDTGHSGACAEITIAAGAGEAVVADDLVLAGTAANLRVAGQGWDDQNPTYGTLTAGSPTNPNVDSPSVAGGSKLGFDGIDYASSGEIIGGTDNFVVNSDIGPYVSSCPPSGMPIANGTTTTRVTFEGNYVHDFSYVNGCTNPHMDCVHVYEFLVGPSSFSRNVIEGCVNYGFLFGGTSDLTVANNWFGDIAFCGAALHGGADSDIFDDIAFENNSGIACIAPQVDNDITNSVMRGNAVTNVGGACRTGMTYSYNKQSQGSGTASVCGTGDAISQTLTFTSTTAGALDLHILSGNPLKDAGGPTCPAMDYDGDSRPAGVACDVGSDEVG